MNNIQNSDSYLNSQSSFSSEQDLNSSLFSNIQSQEENQQQNLTSETQKNTFQEWILNRYDEINQQYSVFENQCQKIQITQQSENQLNISQSREILYKNTEFYNPDQKLQKIRDPQILRPCQFQQQIPLDFCNQNCEKYDNLQDNEIKYSSFDQRQYLNDFKQLWQNNKKIQIICENYFLYHAPVSFLHKFEKVSQLYQKKKNSQNNGKHMIFSFYSLPSFVWGIDNIEKFQHIK
ncbi:hypothetical protein PPERSA_01278 [Pseudocohnilembus persalinus]|uniref:Uncharacterized protein n=1 Tax=Pseudocohnilembus persalinus TaxID=266149 RepID=A0A0V0QGQ3_PSEPJ|nr:hypothetical protein PPERSA_01278 [Pseudocohnilembus persalinus]|eukprot:KRX01375.1 hypothetical protein PPERSA_01278 [Pseudocohnilembus persalinus]